MREARALSLGLLLALGLAAGVTALAHAHLQQSLPSDGSVVRSAPAELVLRFSEPAQLTALAIEQEGGAKQKLAPPSGQPQARIVVPLPLLTPGRYVVSWRALSADGHVVPGQVHFTLTQ
jgi:methionine-rich copper-binding protein CopC